MKSVAEEDEFVLLLLASRMPFSKCAVNACSIPELTGTLKPTESKRAQPDKKSCWSSPEELLLRNSSSKAGMPVACASGTLEGVLWLSSFLKIKQNFGWFQKSERKDLCIFQRLRRRSSSSSSSTRGSGCTCNAAAQPPNKPHLSCTCFQLPPLLCLCCQAPHIPQLAA